MVGNEAMRMLQVTMEHQHRDAADAIIGKPMALNWGMQADHAAPVDRIMQKDPWHLAAVN